MNARPSPGIALAPIARLLGGAVMISFSAVFVKLTSVPPTTSAFYRCAFGGVILLMLVRLRRERLWFGGKGLIPLALASVFFAADLAAWHRSIAYVGPGLATLLASFQVFVLAIAGVAVFGERIRWTVVISIPLALVGLGMIVGFDGSAWTAHDRLGVAFGLATAVFYGAYILTLRRARVRAPQRTSMCDLAVVSVGCAVLLGIGAALNGESLAVPTPFDGGVLLAYGLVAQVLGWVLISSSLSEVPAARVGLILLLQPTLSFAWDVWFFDRPIDGTQALGALLAIAAIYLGSRRTPTR